MTNDSHVAASASTAASLGHRASGIREASGANATVGGARLRPSGVDRGA